MSKQTEQQNQTGAQITNSIRNESQNSMSQNNSYSQTNQPSQTNQNSQNSLRNVSKKDNALNISKTDSLIKPTSGKDKTALYGIESGHFFLFVGIAIAVVVLILIYLLSSTFRVQRSIDKMTLYQNYQTISSLNYNINGDNLLSDFYIATAYNPCHCGYQMIDYTSENILLSCLQSGVRYLEFSIFNSEFGPKAFPVVSMGYKVGEWKMMATDTPLELCFQIIANNAFSVKSRYGGVYNPDDPLFIGLNLNTNSNLDCLNLIATLIMKYFPNNLLGGQDNNLGNIKLAKLMGKIVFFSSDGFQGSGLEELINYCWDNYENNPNHSMQRLYYGDIEQPNFNKTSLIEYNKTKLTIVVPHKEGDIRTTNFDPFIAFNCGCQFVAMNYQNVDTNIDKYITKFKNYSFLLKDDEFRHDGASTPRITTENSTSLPTMFRITRPTNSSTTNPQTTNNQTLN